MHRVVVEKSDERCVLRNNNYKQKSHENVSSITLEDGTHDEDRWQTSTKDAFSVPQDEKMSSIGRRRNLIKSIIRERVIRELEKAEVIPDDGINPSEYIDNYCDPKFIPFLDKPDVDENTTLKYPLYSSNNKSIYKELIEKGTLKSRLEIQNLNEPFRKNCTFTTSPEFAIREPPGGF